MESGGAAGGQTDLISFIKRRVARVIVRLFPDALLTPETEEQVRILGHRRYVGGDWDSIGDMSFAFLREQGLRPDHVLLDIACGSFRLGSRAIPYLDPGNYLGIDREASLIAEGMKHELGEAMIAQKRPEILISADFEFARFSRHPDVAVAFSLFTHLTPDAIDLCLRRLRNVMKPDSRFYATYKPRPRLWRNPSVSNSFASFRYSLSEMTEFAKCNGFTVTEMGDWRPQAIQKMLQFRLA